MLRPMLKTAARSAARNRKSFGPASPASSLRSMATQSGDDAKRPTALAKLHLEDGTTITGTSFGCHESVEGEVSLLSGSSESRPKPYILDELIVCYLILGFSCRLFLLQAWSDTQKV